MPDSNRPFLFERPERPPLGYEAIRAWLRKPRPRLRDAFGWVRLLLSKLFDAGVFIKENARPGAEWVGRPAKKAEPLARAAARIGTGVRKVGVRTAAAANAFRDPEGKRGETARKIRRAGETTQQYGKWITAGAGVAESVSSLLGGLAGAFKSEPPNRIDPRQVEDPLEDPDEAPAAAGRFLPRPPRRLPETGGDQTETVPKQHQPKADAGPGQRHDETRAEPRNRPPATDHGEEETVTPAPAATPEPQAEADLKSDAEPEDRPSLAEHRPSSPAAPTPFPTPPEPPKDRFEGVPELLLRRVKALRERPSREVLYPLILDICHRREWTTAKQLAGWLSMHRRSLVHRHLGKLVDAELLVLRFPDKPRTRHQAYRTNRDKWTPRN